MLNPKFVRGGLENVDTERSGDLSNCQQLYM